MARRLKMAIFAVAGFAVLAGSGASAIEMITPADRGALARQQANDLQVLRNQLQRQQFQQQQQQYREQDRRMPYQPPILVVPKMKPSCKAQAYGSALPQNCR